MLFPFGGVGLHFNAPLLGPFPGQPIGTGSISMNQNCEAVGSMKLVQSFKKKRAVAEISASGDKDTHFSLLHHHIRRITFFLWHDPHAIDWLVPVILDALATVWLLVDGPVCTVHEQNMTDELVHLLLRSLLVLANVSRTGKGGDKVPRPVKYYEEENGNMPEKSFSIVGIMVQGRPGEVEELVTSDEPHLTHLFEFEGDNGEYGMYGIYPRGAVRQGYVSFNPGRVNYFVVTLETPVEGQIERTFNKRLGEVIQAKKLRLVPWKDGSNPMVNLVNQAGKPSEPFMQPGEIEDFHTLPEPGEGQAQLTKGMSVSKPSGYWTVAISAPSDFHGSNAPHYLQKILAAFEETAAPMIQQGLLHFYRIVNKVTSKTVKEEWSKRGREQAADEKQSHQRAINYLYHLGETVFKPYPNLHAEYIKAIQWKTSTKPNGEPPTKVNLETDPSVKMLMGEELPTFRLAIQALKKMDTEEFQLLDKALGIYERLFAEQKSGSKAVDFLMAFASLHSPDHDELEKDLQRLQTREEVGFLLSFGLMSRILNNAKELEEVGYGAVVARVQHAASKGLEAVATEPSKDALRDLAHDAKSILKLKGVIEIPPTLEEFLRKAVEEKNKPRQERQPEREVTKPTKATAGKSGKGMSYDAVEAQLRLNGLTPLSSGPHSGSKYFQSVGVRLLRKASTSSRLPCSAA
jgi:hypothetical protein